MKPKRIQRKRTKGWKMPENTVYVGRPTQWGNPFKIAPGHDAAKCVEEFRQDLQRRMDSGMGYPLMALAGKNLACFCSLDKPCHADVLLEFVQKYCKIDGGSDDHHGTGRGGGRHRV